MPYPKINSDTASICSDSLLHCLMKHFLFSIDGNTSLDDSLTNIQWLCNLDSHPLLETDPRQNVPTEPATPMNPYPKPPFSYATLILFAINSTFEKRMTLQDIYKWIEDNFPYYKHCKKAWKVGSLKRKLCASVTNYKYNKIVID